MTSGADDRLLRVGERLLPWSRVREVALERMEREGALTVFLDGDDAPLELTGADAVDFVMRVAPSFFEGRRFAWVRSAWALHNLIGHPLLQIFAWAKLTRLGLVVHDATIPRPGR